MSFRTVYNYTYSEAGWRMCNRDECVMVNTAPHMDTAPLRSGSPAIILGAWAGWLHANVRPITSPVWGWSAQNKVGNSNHLAGVSIDVWAPIRPWGLRTMPRNEIDKVRFGMTLFPEIFWGADWNNPDEMHFQMRWSEGDPRNAAGAARISGNKPLPTVPVTLPPIQGDLLLRGSTGERVKVLQSRLNRDYPAYSRLVVDGDFGPGTEAVVREFQKRAGLTVDGVVGPATLNRLGL